MRYQELLVNLAKCVRAHTRRNYVVANICRSNSWNAKFVDRLTTQIPSSRKYYYNDNRKFYKGSGSLFILSGLFYGLIELFKSDEDQVPKLILNIKRSILLIQKGEFKKAEQMLHIALREAQTLQHYNAITYIYDVMANLAFDTEDYKKAEKLFLSVLERLFAKGAKEDDLRVIHISLKMAKVFEETGDMKKAETGYKYCLEKLHSHVISGETENEHVGGLLGMTADWYGHMLFVQARYEESLQYYTQAYKIYTKLHTTSDEQTVVLLNDLGSVSYMLEKYDKAIEYLQAAAKLEEEFTTMMDGASVHVNIGNVYIKQKLYDEARKSCETGKKMAQDHGDDVSLKQAEECLKEITKLMA